ncbi:MAG: apolipoprotein N-acyltransferase [Phycisphaeraceae bacterium]|nr:apolipoprotein N-acyltransferase [Phycisphaeraceae bacterium]
MKRLLLPLLAGLAHALLLLLAFPPIGLWPFTLVAIAPLVWLALRPTRVNWKDAIAASLGASAFYWYQQQWVIEISTAGYFPLVMYLSIYPGLFVYLLNVLRRSFPRMPLSLLIPIAWTGLEWLRGELVWDGYSWFLISHPLIDAPALSLCGSVIGAYGVGALLASMVGIVFDFLVPIPPRDARPTRFRIRGMGPARLALCAAIVAIYFGATNLATRNPALAVAQPEIRVGIVQTNLPQDNKVAWTFEQRQEDFPRFLQLTRDAAAQNPALILWPETMFPGTFLEPFEDVDTNGRVTGKRIVSFANSLLQFQKELGIPMLVGAIGTDRLRLVPDPDKQDSHFISDHRFNSVFLLKDGRVDPLRYDKIRLTPFGETMPYISSWPWLQKSLLSIGASGMSFDLDRGSTDRIGGFEFSPTTPSPDSKRPEVVRVVTPICFEITESSLCRKLVNRAAQGRARVLIANVTNDGWFGSFDPARVEHQMAARWRSLELGVAVVRAANTGISSVTEYGRENGNRLINVEGRSSRVAGVLVDNVALFRGTTFFREYGDFCWVFPLALGTLLILAFRRRTPNNSVAATGSSLPTGGSS